MRCAALALLLVGCSSGSATPSGPTVRFVLPAGGSLPDVLDVPFPSDAYLDRPGGHIVDPLPGLERLLPSNADAVAHQLAALDGFSRVGFSFFYVDDGDDFAKVDPATLPANEDACAAAESSVALIDVEDGAHLPCRATYHDDTRFGAKSRPVLAVGPARGIVLAEGHRYAAVVTSRVRDEAGRALQASADFARAPELGAIYADALAKAGASAVGVAAFTTHRATADLVLARALLDTLPPPRLAWDAASLAPMGAARFAQKPTSGFTATLDDWLGKVDPAHKLPDGTDDPDELLPVRAHDRVAAIGTAAFDAPNFLITRPGGYTDLAHATFARDAAGRVAPAPDKPTAKVWITIAVPDAPMPPSGYPAVILQHGSGSSRAYLLSLANTFAQKGWISVAIDVLTFGARAPEPKYQVDRGTDYTGAYTGPDGLADAPRNGPLDFSGAPLSSAAFRDQLRQAALDTSTVVRLLKSGPDLSPLATGGPAPRVDPDRLGIVSDSLGANIAALAAAIEPGLRAWVLNVAGAPLYLEAFNHAGQSGQLFTAGTVILYGLAGDRMSESHPLTNLLQTIIEPGDPAIYAGGLAPAARNVLQIEVVYDELMGNEGAEALARAGGWGIAAPNVGPNAGVPLASLAPDADGVHDTPRAGMTAAIVQVDPGAHSTDLLRSKGERHSRIPFAQFDADDPFVALPQPFTVRSPYRELQACVTGFLDDAFAGRAPRVKGFAAPVRDYDDDGAPDDADSDPSDPAKP